MLSFARFAHSVRRASHATRSYCTKIPRSASVRHYRCAQTCHAAVALNFCDTQQKEKMQHFIQAMLAQNKVMNLTATEEFDKAWQVHVEDSLALLPTLDGCLGHNDAPRRLIDVGSGNGIPGIVFAISRPHWQVCLLDSLQKRCKFLEQAVSSLGIPNVEVVWARAEAAGQKPEMREVYDCACARAVADMRVLSELCLPFVRIGGHFIAVKGPDPEREVRSSMKAMELLGGTYERTDTTESSGHGGLRSAVLVRKTAKTPDAYPRKEGKPQKRPL